MEKEKDWTVLRLLQWTTDYFEARGFDSPRTTSEMLLAHVLSYKRLDLYLQFDKPVLQPELSRFREAVKRRLRNEPVQYIIGETEFYSLKLRVDRSVLIPRPETEILVDKAVQNCSERFGAEEQLTLLDVGTGSGNVAIGIAGNIPAADINAMDISKDALALAKKNAEMNGLNGRIHFRELSLFSAGPSEFMNLSGVVSNPPYVAPQDYALLPAEIRDYEPECALSDGGDGFTFYPELCRRSMEWLRTGGFLLVETGMGGAPKVASIFRDSGFCNIEIIRDLNDIERVVCGWKP